MYQQISEGGGLYDFNELTTSTFDNIESFAIPNLEGATTDIWGVGLYSHTK